MDNSKTEKKPPREQSGRSFGSGPSDIGTWSYDHRVGLCVTVIAYLAAAIIFVSVRIVFGQKSDTQRFYIDMLPEPVEQPVEEQREMVPAGYDFSDVRNRASNEHAPGSDERGGSTGAPDAGLLPDELNASLRDAHGTDASEIYSEAAAVQAGMQANRAALRRGLSENDALARRTQPSETAGQRREDARVKGNVTVSFSLSNPVRTSEKLVVPAYLCEGGGQVVVFITVDRSGYVTAASIDRSQSSPDGCMTSTALEAARQSRFNLDTSAPEKHQGTITYLFVPQ